MIVLIDLLYSSTVDLVGLYPPEDKPAELSPAPVFPMLGDDKVAGEVVQFVPSYVSVIAT